MLFSPLFISFISIITRIRIFSCIHSSLITFKQSPNHNIERRKKVLEAEGDKRSAELESEGAKIRMKNESEGTLIKVQNEAQARKVQLILEVRW